MNLLNPHFGVNTVITAVHCYFDETILGKNVSYCEIHSLVSAPSMHNKKGRRLQSVGLTIGLTDGWT